ncbi:MAG: tetratricopeptide repeat protein [Chloroflexi bacterium]|nr:tetratricopeptide repeat protein [Chloroflexota bacterium]
MNEHLEWAERDYRANRFREAADGYTKAIDAEPSNVDAYNGLARCLLHLRLYDQAVTVCRKGIEIDPQNAKLHGNLGYAHLSLGRLSESETQFRRAVLLDPKLVPAQLGLARVLGRQQKYRDAETPLRDVIEMEPDNVTALCALRLVYVQNHKIPEALILARRVLSLAPGPGSLFDYFDTQMLGHRVLAGGVMLALCAAAFLLPSSVSWLALGVVIAFLAWAGIRFIRTGQPRMVVGVAVTSLLLLAAYALLRAS